jgi:hypothetical protein
LLLSLLVLLLLVLIVVPVALFDAVVATVVDEVSGR